MSVNSALSLSLWTTVQATILTGSCRKSAARILRVKVVKLVRNFGSTNAQLAGIGYSTGDAVVIISADLQDPPELIHDMLPLWKNGTRMVFAARNQRDDPFSTRLPADIFNFMFRNFALKKYPKGGFDCFLIDRQVVNVVIQCAEKNTHLPGLLVWSGFEYEIIYYHRQERKHGKSRWNLSRKLKYFADAFTAFSYLPLRLCTALGFFLAFGPCLRGSFSFLPVIWQNPGRGLDHPDDNSPDYGWHTIIDVRHRW